MKIYKPIKMLRTSCHSILEYDDLKLFHAIGVDVVSLGAYKEPDKPGDKKRPALDYQIHPEDLAAIGDCHSDKITKDLADRFDVIYIDHKPSFLRNNWENIKHKKVIWRSIGQSSVDVEEFLKPYREQGLLIVRYSPKERLISGYVGEDAMIRFYKDENEFKDWTGKKNRAMTIGQSMVERDAFCGYNIFKQATEGFDRKLFGPENEGAGDIWGGCISYEQLKQELRENRVYFYTGTKPASYTLNFIEAYITGTPIVAIGPKLGNPQFLEGQETYEAHELIADQESGFYSDDVEELKSYVAMLMNNYDLAKRIGEAGRKRAIELFGYEKIKQDWINFFVEQFSSSQMSVDAEKKV